MVRRTPVILSRGDGEGSRRPRSFASLRMTSRGYTLLEVVVALAIFGIFIFMLVEITAEMNANEKRNPVNFMAHPQVSAVLSRLRRDVWDSIGYPGTYDKYTQGTRVLILDVLRQDGTTEYVVYDFTIAEEVHRLSFAVGAQTSEWIARGLPQFRVDSYMMPDNRWAVRILAADKKGTLAVDQILEPRPH